MSSTLRQRRSKAKVKRAAHKRERTADHVAVDAVVSSVAPVIARAKALMTKLDGNPEIRVQLIARLTRAAQKAPVVALHRCCMALETMVGDQE